MIGVGLVVVGVDAHAGDFDHEAGGRRSFPREGEFGKGLRKAFPTAGESARPAREVLPMLPDMGLRRIKRGLHGMARVVAAMNGGRLAWAG